MNKIGLSHIAKEALRLLHEKLSFVGLIEGQANAP